MDNPNTLPSKKTRNAQKYRAVRVARPHTYTQRLRSDSSGVTDGFIHTYVQRAATGLQRIRELGGHLFMDDNDT
jgi:hypothetical protein